MSSLADSALSGGTGVNGIAVWQPLAFAAGTAQGAALATSTTSASSGTSTATPAAGYVSALFVQASCTAAEVVGGTVRAGADASSVSLVTSSDPYPAIGVVVSKTSDTACLVQTFGLCTALSGLTANSRYFVGPSGKPSLIADLTGSGAFVQPIGFATGTATFFVQPTGILYQRAANTNAAGDDAAPTPSGSTQTTYYGGVLFGTTAPTDDVGSVGDTYFQYATATSIICFGPKAPDGWGDGLSLVGAAGKDGNAIFVRTTAPDDSVTPSVGDVWFEAPADGSELVFYAAS